MHATATLAAAIEEGSTRLHSAGNEQAATTEQVRVAVESMAVGIEETATSTQELARSQESVADMAKTLRESSEGSAATFQELSASIGAVKKDAALLAVGSDGTGDHARGTRAVE